MHNFDSNIDSIEISLASSVEMIVNKDTAQLDFSKGIDKYDNKIVINKYRLRNG